MKIRVDLHNPLRGTCTCEHCHTPIIHGEDSLHAYLAKDVASAFGDTFDGVHTKKEWFPAMMNKFAEILAGRAKNYLFCPYCGKAVIQPRVSNITGKPVLPNIFANNEQAIGRWAEELNIDVPTGYQKYQEVRYAQEKDVKVIWG